MFDLLRCKLRHWAWQWRLPRGVFRQRLPRRRTRFALSADRIYMQLRHTAPELKNEQIALRKQQLRMAIQGVLNGMRVCPVNLSPAEFYYPFSSGQMRNGWRPTFDDTAAIVYRTRCVTVALLIRQVRRETMPEFAEDGVIAVLDAVLLGEGDRLVGQLTNPSAPVRLFAHTVIFPSPCLHHSDKAKQLRVNWQEYYRKLNRLAYNHYVYGKLPHDFN